jgi:glycerophosphoryl diester phosphodiesterase
MKLFKNRFIAHRGLHKNKMIPENSMLAFKALFHLRQIN